MADKRVKIWFDPEGDFLEVFVDCPVEVCEQRDPKGHYRKARAGEMKEFTGISAPYEAPLSPDVVVRTDKMSEAEGVAHILGHLEQRGYVSPAR